MTLQEWKNKHDAQYPERKIRSISLEDLLKIQFDKNEQEQE